MNILPVFKPFLIALTATAFASETSPVNAQANPKKVRIGVSETHVGYLPLQVAFHKAITKMRASTLVRASLRGLLFLSDARNRDEVVQIIMKQHNVSDRQLAEQMLGYSFRVVTKEAHVTNAEVQY